MQKEQTTRRLSDIKVDNPYLRMGTDVSRIEKSIQTVGLIAPLVITPDNRLLAGGRRYQALLNLGFEEAPVKIVSADELESELISIDENLVRKDLNKIEMEAHFKRAKELYEALHEEPEVFEENTSKESETSTREETHEQMAEEGPSEQHADPEAEDEDSTETHSSNKKDKTQQEVPKQRLASEEFYESISEKTGMSPKQIQQAITREEKASPEVKEARARGELSLSQTNELIKLDKKDQSKALDQLKVRPVREIRHIIKLAKTKGIDQALSDSPEGPHAREFREFEAHLKKLNRLLKRFEMEKIDMTLLPQKTTQHLQELMNNLNELSSEPQFEEIATSESQGPESCQYQ